MRLFPRSSGGRVAVGVLALGMLLTACGSGADGGPTSDKPITLTLGHQGNQGLDGLIKEYEQAHPGIKIEQRSLEYNAHHETLARRLAAGSGANDLEWVEEGFVVQFRSQPDRFVNLLDLGLDKHKDRWLPWKWQQSLSADGKTQIGMGLDVGGLAMCYRKDLFEKAGLPTKREEVSKLWPDWAGYFATGEKFTAAKTGAAFVDTASNIYNARVAQLPQSYYDSLDGGGDKLIVESNAELKQAFMETAQHARPGRLSAGLNAFTPQWTAGFQKGSFATVTCPAWMLGYIEANAPKTAGLWDVATIPGGGGNWGGSFITIPKQGKHTKAAYDLALWLTAPEQQAKIFKAVGNFPSAPKLYDQPEFTGLKAKFFNDAPTGKIYGEAAKTLEPQYLGPKHGPVRVAFEQALARVQQRGQSPEAAWKQAVDEAKAAAEQ